MFRCVDCGHVFKDPDGRRIHMGTFEAFGVRQHQYGLQECCPECDGTDLNEFRACDECMTEEAEPDDDLCSGCAALEAEQELDYTLDMREDPDFMRRRA